MRAGTQSLEDYCLKNGLKKLLNEWDDEKNAPLTPNQVAATSKKKVWWKCEKGHEWQAFIFGRATMNRGCPYCSGKNVIAGENDLATLYPEIAAEWDYEKNAPLTPDQVSASSRKKIWWRCAKGHEWQAFIFARTTMNSKCPYCSGKKAITGENDLATLYPEIAAEWDYEKNAPLLPSEVLPMSNKKVWWKRADGHEWQAVIASRTKSIAKGETRKIDSDAKLPPEVISLWNYEKNAPLTPEQVTMKSQQKVWWKCDKGHEWKARIYSVAINGTRCPYCAGLKAVPGENDLATLYPELAAQWDYEKNVPLLPSDVLPRSAKKVWWKCEKGHEWQATVSARTALNTGCPYCNGRRVITGENDLATLYPKIAAEWNYEKNAPLLPSEVLPMSNKKVWWKCKEGHEWQAFIHDRTNKKTNCPYCARHRTISKQKTTKNPQNSIGKKRKKETKYSQENLSGKSLRAGHTSLEDYCRKEGLEKILNEWEHEKNLPLTPATVSYQSNKKVWWKCEKGHEWQATVNNRVGKSSACPYCAGKKVLSGYNDLATLRPDLSAEWHPTLNGALTPSMVMQNSAAKVWWLCPKGHAYQASINNRTCKNSGCPYCAGQKVLPGFNDLATKYPELAKQWHPTLNGDLTPDKVTPGSNKKVWWICSEGHVWEAIINNRARKHYGCPICTGRIKKRS